ncbi:MAG: KTSC domain-containing protein [Nostoc sp. DedQUE12b]|uniref:KTSC domain-containing protein n=1 Tax=Nostoc sp. DedQUE12b TaxID=3075398 RepID=UPI002AD38220|nr:KTSC domain-containing protein [Nostoc sp. DedQUE12b]MDZ8089423.1 KTSC domain-containing protein [Nostoc sp. DedQUE12b]
MLRTRVSSSDLQSVGYDATTCTLEIKFHSGGIYQYFKVPEAIYRRLMAASLHGKYFHACIKDLYSYQKIA